jgi:thiamine pyrophosphate-dependent acetolactate synthase large subunit-like protein
MKRYSVIRILNGALEKGDVGIFIGDDVCRETFPYHREGNLYLPYDEGTFSVGLGIAMNTLKRVFIFCDDAYFLKNMGEVLHIAASKCRNIFIIVLVSGVYSGSAKHPTIFKSIHSPIGMLFNMGFVVHDYKRHFKNSRNPVKEIRAIWQKSKGPLAVVVEVEGSSKVFLDNYILEEKSLSDIMNFIQNKEIISYSYSPPVFIEAFEEKE